MSEVEAHKATMAEADPALPKWPPPGLERIQGDLLTVAQRAGLASILLVLPLLLIAAREQDFASLGPFADAWWVPPFLMTVGLALALDAMARLTRGLRRSARAVDGGYDVLTVLRVLSDGGHDTGFLINGARHFAVLEPREREGIASIRVVAAVLLASAGTWMILAVTIGLFFAARGALSPRALELLTIGPGSLLYVLGAVAALIQEGRVRRARRVWHKQPWADDMASGEIRAWQEAYGGRRTAVGLTARTLGITGIVVGALAVPVVLPVLTLAPASAIAPVLTTIAMPSFDTYRQRIARVEAYRTYAIEGDVTVTPNEAGELLHDLLFVGAEVREVPGQRPPSTVEGRPWLADADRDDNPFGLEPYVWGDSLVERVAQGVTAEQRAYLRTLTSHPSTPDFRRLARATALDAGQARWVLPFPPGTTMATVPIPNYRTLRDAVDVQVAAAALALVEGRPDDAEVRLREIIALGFLLTDEGPTLIDNLVGVTTVEAGGRALADLYRATGRSGAAAELSRLVELGDRAAAMMPSTYPLTAEAFVRSLPHLVLDTTSVRGLRWEYFINLATMAPCMNVHRIVFGSDQEYADFVDEAHTSLVRWPSDEALFDLARHGWVGVGDAGRPSLLSRVVSLYINSEENSCARILQDIGTAESF